MKVSKIYFHRDFDGVASAALVLRACIEQEYSTVELESVDYGIPWVDQRLTRPCAVVDFLYHSDATFFWDHHSSPFPVEQWASHYEQRKKRGDSIWWDASYPSCASLILSTAPQLRDDPALVELARWSDIIDSAGYSSAEQVIRASEAALRLNLALASASEEFYAAVVRFLTRLPLDEVVSQPEVAARIENARKLQNEELRYFRSRMHSVDSVVLAEVADRVLSYSRYAPYHFDRDALYSVVLFRSPTGLKVLSMRNPWIQFDSLHLGDLCRRLGGGGHERVGAIAFSPDEHERAVSAFTTIAGTVRSHAKSVRALILESV